MAAQEGANYADVAQKNDQVDEKLAQDDAALAALEADLQAAESRVDVAQDRYLRARRAAERELKAGGADGAASRAAGGAGADMDEDAHADAKADKIPSHLASHTAKNAGARTDKEVSSARWVAARAAESRVRDRAVKARNRLRRSARDRKFESFDQSAVPAAEAPEPAKAAAPAPDAKAASPAAPPAGETQGVKDGAAAVAERVKCLKERPNAAEKHAALVRVATGGKDNYYTFEPADVVKDLKARGLVDAADADALLSLLAEAPGAKASEAPAEGWAAGAQKASGIERLDDKPFKDEEFAYLRFVEERGLLAAEAELEAAEKQLGGLISKAEETYGALGDDDDDDGDAPRRQVSGDQQVDEDEADRLEARYDPDGHKESHGKKNTSALNPKEVSRDKWEKAHSKEGRDREHDQKVRDAKRSEARDMKQHAGDVA